MGHALERMDDWPASADAVVVGGGVIGASVAYRLAQRGRRVALLERDGLGAGTSGACEGAVMLQSKQPGLHLELAIASSELYEHLAEELQHDVEFGRHGGMVVVESEAHLPVVTEFVSRQQRAGVPVELLPATEARRLQPALAPAVVGATWSPRDGQVNPLSLCFGFAQAARRLGARCLTGTPVTGLRLERGRVVAVETPRGRIATELVVNCAGVWAPALGRLAGVDIPIAPVRGQILVSERSPRLIRGEVLSSGYLVAKWRPDLMPAGAAARLRVGLSLTQVRTGNLLVGGCREEDAGLDRRTTAEALAVIAGHAQRLFPDLARLSIIRTFAGLRPTTPDGLPIIGPVPGVEGLFLCAGHGGDGNALAPVSGVLAADLIGGGPAAPLGRQLGLERFQSATEDEENRRCPPAPWRSTGR